MPSLMRNQSAKREKWMTTGWHAEKQLSKSGCCFIVFNNVPFSLKLNYQAPGFSWWKWGRSVSAVLQRNSIFISLLCVHILRVASVKAGIVDEKDVRDIGITLFHLDNLAFTPLLTAALRRQRKINNAAPKMQIWSADVLQMSIITPLLPR